MVNQVVSIATRTRKKSPAKKAPPKRKGREVKQTRFERGLTYTMAAFIPVMSLVIARSSGVLLTQGYPVLAGFGGFIAVMVLSVSLPHLAHAIGLVTASHQRVSWALAVAFDLGIVFAELTHSIGPDDLRILTLGMLISLTSMSAVLNGIAFTRR